MNEHRSNVAVHRCTIGILLSLFFSTVLMVEMKSPVSAAQTIKV